MLDSRKRAREVASPWIMSTFHEVLATAPHQDLTQGRIHDGVLPKY
jgi:hypothetical protein